MDDTAIPTQRNHRDAALRDRARQVIPGGLWGHLNAANLPAGYPQYFARAEGCRLWDVDGREVVDFMCAWGPVVLGHHHPAVEEAARRQAALGDCMNGPAPVLVDLAEMLVATIPHADWCLLEKNGTDATTACVTIARAGTGRRKVLVARGSYHGAVPWCSPSLAGVTAEDRAHLLHFDYNDAASLQAAADQAKGDLAAVIVTAFRHDMVQPGWSTWQHLGCYPRAGDPSVFQFGENVHVVDGSDRDRPVFVSANGAIKVWSHDPSLPRDFENKPGCTRVLIGADITAVHNTVALTPAGEAHPIMRLAASPAETRQRWASLPALAGSAPLVVRALKRELGVDRAALQSALETEAREQSISYRSRDLGEGLKAAAERRAAVFSGE